LCAYGTASKGILYRNNNNNNKNTEARKGFKGEALQATKARPEKGTEEKRRKEKRERERRRG
jgi:hypothetical protein